MSDVGSRANGVGRRSRCVERWSETWNHVLRGVRWFLLCMGRGSACFDMCMCVQMTWNDEILRFEDVMCNATCLSLVEDGMTLAKEAGFWTVLAGLGSDGFCCGFFGLFDIYFESILKEVLLKL